MNEQEFIESIDFNFPYQDGVKALELIDQAKKISSNASFMVLHEIVRAPTDVDHEVRKKLYKQWLSGFNHKLLPIVREAAESLLSGSELSISRVLELMQHIEPEVGQYCALGIIYFACDDQEGKVDDLYNQIIEQWQSA
ncbi:hypothetical protein [Zooshikella ganghwensis]|uniref:hypothetical protein n=1 Tax=Zooshikella ganghwensis TaxID=202772 RepID=UPI00041E8ED0|nr:hypothetical protein [Zooshikella ganghwensis]